MAPRPTAPRRDEEMQMTRTKRRRPAPGGMGISSEAPRGNCISSARWEKTQWVCSEAARAGAFWAAQMFQRSAPAARARKAKTPKQSATPGGGAPAVDVVTDHAQ